MSANVLLVDDDADFGRPSWTACVVTRCAPRRTRRLRRPASSATSTSSSTSTCAQWGGSNCADAAAESSTSPGHRDDRVRKPRRRGGRHPRGGRLHQQADRDRGDRRRTRCSPPACAKRWSPSHRGKGACRATMSRRSTEQPTKARIPCHASPRLEASVLVKQESGISKEVVVASSIDGACARRGRSRNQLRRPRAARERVLGRVRGASTDARESRSGLFVQARGGTLFLDEIGEMAIAVSTEAVARPPRADGPPSRREPPRSRSTFGSSRRPTAIQSSAGRRRTPSRRPLLPNQRRPGRAPPSRARGGDILPLAVHFGPSIRAAGEQGGHGGSRTRSPKSLPRMRGLATSASCRTAWILPALNAVRTDWRRRSPDKCGATASRTS